MKYLIGTLCIVLILQWKDSGAQGFQSKTHYIVSVQRQAWTSIIQGERFKQLADSLESVLQAYRVNDSNQIELIEKLNRINGEQSNQEVFYKEIIASKDNEIKIVTKAAKKHNSGKKFWKITAIVFATSTAVLLVTN